MYRNRKICRNTRCTYSPTNGCKTGYYSPCEIIRINNTGFCSPECQWEVEEEREKISGSIVSLGWVLNELSGMKFPKQGEAYDYIVKLAKERGLDIK